MIISDTEIGTQLPALGAHAYLCCVSRSVVFWVNLAEKNVPLQFFLLYVTLICWKRTVLVFSLRNQAAAVELHLPIFSTRQTNARGGIPVMARTECH